MGIEIHPLRCIITSHPCGTDTVASLCQCPPCRAHAEVASLRAELAEQTELSASALERCAELAERLAPLRAAARQDAEALDRYRYAVAFAGADSWDGGPDMRQRLEWARASDPGGNLPNDRVAEIGQTFPVHMRAVPRCQERIRQDAEDRAADIEAAEKRGYDCGVNDITRQDAEEIARLHEENGRLTADYNRSLANIAAARALVDQQANDERLWKTPLSHPHDDVQRALRRLHEAVEGISSEECARAALACRPQGEKS